MTAKSKSDAAAKEQIANDVVADKIHEDGRARLSIKISDLITSDDRRPANPEAVKAIAESFSVIGQKTPISVSADCSEPGKYVLIAGDKRVKAAELLGLTHIEAFIEQCNEIDAELWQISENLARQDLTVQEEADHVARWLELIQSRNGQVVQSTSAAARSLPVPGKSQGARRKAVERAIKIHGIVEEAKKAAKAAGLDDNQEALLDIARESGREAQLKKVAELEAHKSTRAIATKVGAGSDLPIVSAPSLQPVDTADRNKEAVDLLVLTPDAGQIVLLGENYGEEDKLERALPPLVKQVAAAGAVVVFARVRDVSVIVDRLLLPVCGFRAGFRVLLVHRPNTSDITDCEVLIIAERGGFNLIAPTNGWIDADKPIDALAIAASMYPEAKNRVNVFASAQVEGWQCLLTSESWAEK